MIIEIKHKNKILNIKLEKLLKLTVMEENQRGSHDLYVQPLAIL